MPAKSLQILWEDAFGGRLTTSLDVDDSYNIADAETIAALNAHRALSQARIVSIHEVKSLDISGLTNGAAVSTGQYDRVKDKAALQLRVTASGQVKQVTIPAPVDSLFLTTGSYAYQEVVGPATAPLAAWIAASITEPFLVSAEGSAVTYRKGWRVGQPHP